jgi:hypothetical protein
MSFASTLDVLRPTLPFYLALAKYRLLRLSRDNFELHPNPAAPPLATAMAQAVFAMGASTCIESYVTSRTLAEGPKVFAFNALTCEALENFELSLGTADYLQPFPSVVIDLPTCRWRAATAAAKLPAPTAVDWLTRWITRADEEGTDPGPKGAGPPATQPSPAACRESPSAGRPLVDTNGSACHTRRQAWPPLRAVRRSPLTYRPDPLEPLLSAEACKSGGSSFLAQQAA